MTAVADRPAATPETPVPTPPASRSRWLRVLVVVALGLLALSALEEFTGTDGVLSSGTTGATLRLAAPILLAALAALMSERVGVINIGIEGMMILGMWFGAWAGWSYGPWWGVLAGVLAGMAAGLLHAIATVGFGVDQIISGVAINLLGEGLARYLSVTVYADVEGGGATQSPRVGADTGEVGLPWLSGGFGTTDLLGDLEDQELFWLSDVAGVLRGATGDLAWLQVLVYALVPFVAFALWRTALGLRLRSVGEHPEAAESLGVNVRAMRTLGVMCSGGLAGLGGAYFAVEAAGFYKQGQTGGRGFIGIAAMIFGNWRPSGALLGAGLFGYADALQLRGENEAVHALLLLVAIGLAAVAIRSFMGGKVRRGVLLGGFGVMLGAVFFLTDELPNELIQVLPHIITLFVLGFAAQRLKAPGAIGRNFRRGG